MEYRCFHKLIAGAFASVIALSLANNGLGKQQDKKPVPSHPEKPSNLVGADLALVDNHDPAVEQANFDLLDGFEVNLFATDPMLANPVHMTWGPNGKLYVACSWAYPQLKPGEKANDKIIVLEDMDGDGRADKSVVFADGLYLPTGLELASGGVYVAQSPHILFLKDTTGDGRADHREIALTGFGIEDSHHTNSAWRRGPGGWLYFQEGRFLHTQVETQFGTVRNYNGGVYQFNPRTGELRVFANVNVGNPWGHVFDVWGQSFLVDNPRISYLTPTTGNKSKKRSPFVLAQTEKQCGGDLVSGTHMPPELQGQLLSGRFKSRTVIRYEFGDDRSGFTANVLEPLMSSRHPNFRPVDVKIGPDGAVYVADWYNSIINHAGHDFRDPLRDQDHGRIWRITAKNRPLVEKPKLVGQPLNRLLDELKSPNAWTRHYARLVISERNPADVVAALEQWTNGLNTNDPRYDQHLVEALWTYQNVGQSNEPLLRKTLQAKTGEARAAAARLIRYWHADLSDSVALLKHAAIDPFPRVRLEAILSAGFVPDGRALVAALHALDLPRDPFIDAALDQTIAALAEQITPELVFANPSHATFAQRFAGLGVSERLNKLLKDGSGGAEELELIRSQFKQNPDSKGINQIIRALTKRNGNMTPKVSLAMLDVLSSLGRRQQISIPDKIASLSKFLDRAQPELVPAILDTLAACKVGSSSPKIIKLLNDVGVPLDIRIAAARAMGELDTPEGRKALVDMGGDSNDVLGQSIAVHGLVVNQADAAAPIAAEIFSMDSPHVDVIGLIDAFLKRRKATNALVKVVGNRKPHPSICSLVTTHFNRTGTLPGILARHFRPKLNSRLANQLLKENVDTLAAEVVKKGDAQRGELIYRRKILACASCHGIGQVGPNVGPDLAAVGAASKTAYIVDSILRPNKVIAEHYETFVIMTIDGEMHKGLITFQNEFEVILRDPSKKEPIRIAIDDIEGKRQGESLMPTGLTENLADKQEFLDLALFLSRLGRPGPYMTTTQPVIRRWRVLKDERPTHQLELAAIPSEANWIPAYSMVRGELLSEDFAGQHSAFVRGVVNVQKPGMASINLNSPKGLRVWLDKTELDDPATAFDLTKGRHEITFLIDNKLRNGVGLRVELIDDPLKKAMYQVEGGE